MFLSTFNDDDKEVVLFSQTARTFIGMGESSHLQPFWMGFAKKKWGFPTPSGVSPFHSFKRTWEGKHFQGQNPMNAACIQKRKNICSEFFCSGGTEFVLVGEERWWWMATKLCLKVWSSPCSSYEMPNYRLIGQKICLSLISLLVWWSLKSLTF